MAFPTDTVGAVLEIARSTRAGFATTLTTTIGANQDSIKSSGCGCITPADCTLTLGGVVEIIISTRGMLGATDSAADGATVVITRSLRAGVAAIC
jgi:hypothetical protein